MLRYALLKTALLAAPAVIYAFYLLFRRREGLLSALRDHGFGFRIAIAVGIFLMMGSLPLLRYLSEDFTQGAYRPAFYRDGVLHPAQIEPPAEKR